MSILEDARRYIEALRPGGDVRRAMSRSFRSVPALLAFVNDVSRDMPKSEGRRDAFLYGEDDCFPLDGAVIDAADHSLGLVTGDTPDACAETTAAEIARLLAEGTLVRDKATGVRRPVTPTFSLDASLMRPVILSRMPRSARRRWYRAPFAPPAPTPKAATESFSRRIRGNTSCWSSEWDSRRRSGRSRVVPPARRK